MKFLKLENKTTQIIVLVIISIIWSTSFILMKKGLRSFEPVQVGSLRIFFAALFLLPFLFKRLKQFKKKDIKSLLIVGFIGNLFPAILFAKAQTHINSSLAGMLNSLFPIFVLIIGVLFYGLKTRRNKVLGIIIGLIGSMGLIGGDFSDFAASNSSYSLYIVLAIIFYAFSINEIKTKLPDLDGLSTTVFSFMFIAPFALLAFVLTDYSSALSRPNAFENLCYIILLAFLSSVLALVLYYKLIEYVDVVFASLTTYLIPVFAIFWGLADGEKISFLQIIFMIIIFVGVYIVSYKKKR